MYMAPEILKGKEPFDGEAVDIWSIGCILLFMAAGGQLNGYGNLSSDGIELLNNMKEVDPLKRITLNEINNHRWLNDD